MRLSRPLQTTSFRLALIYAVLFASSVLILGAFIFWTARSALDQQLRNRIETESVSLQAEFRSGGREHLVSVVSQRGRSRATTALSYAVVGPNGERLAGELPLTSRLAGWMDIDGDGNGIGGTANVERLRALIVQLSDGSRLAVAADLEQIDEVEEAILGAFGSAVGIVLILGIVGGLALSIGFLRRVDNITLTAEAIIGGDLTQRIPTRRSNDDFDRLALTLNRMLDRIVDLMESLRQVSNDIAHDLRMPLARLRQRLELMRDHSQAQQNGPDIDTAIAETDTILETFGALLRIAQIEAGTRRSGFRDVDLSAVFETVIDAFAPSVEDAGKSLVTQVAKNVMIRGDRELLTQMLVNLVENAIRHTPDGARIEVSLTATSDGAIGVVADNGPGIPEAERDRIFRRFYRLEHSRSTPGNGLGLTLVAAVATLHNIKIELQHNNPGLRLILSLPGTLAKNAST